VPERISFSRSLYRSDAVTAVAGVYAELATFAVDASAEHEVVVTITDPHPSLADELADAFSNHVLFESIRRFREEQGGAV